MMASRFLLVLLSVAALSLPVTHARVVAPPRPMDCDEVFRSGSIHSGVYTIFPGGQGQPIKVYCDMDCEDHENRGGWTLFQRRFDGSVNFYRPFEHYKNGFGNVSGEHWLGLENLHNIIWQRKYKLRVEMEDFEGGNVHACYDSFSIDSESEGYRLHVGSYVDGGAGNALVYSNYQRFSTFDKDQYHGYYYYGNNAGKWEGGFWFGYYPYANPNGVYKWGRHSDKYTGVTWKSWKGSYYSLKSISMKIKPVSLQEARQNPGVSPGYY